MTFLQCHKHSLQWFNSLIFQTQRHGTMHVLICDDSALARKSLNKAICSQFNVETAFCENGREALDYISQHKVDILFLDLTMPVMDGFHVLQALPVNRHDTKIIVISGDVQQQAKDRCLALGAFDFLNKPFDQTHLFALLTQLNAPICTECVVPSLPDVDPQIKFKEVTNIALGSAAALVSDKIGIFIELPIPTVGVLEASELRMTIADALHRENLHAVAQRFVGAGFNGEALVCMRGCGIDQIGRSLGFSRDESSLDEIVLNLANLLISTFINSLSDQISINFSLRQPMSLKNSYAEKNTLQDINESAFTVEFTYYAENMDFECEVLLFFDSESVTVINRLMETL